MIPDNTTPVYLANLTPLRGIAALLTVIFHVDLMLGNGGDMLLRFSDSRFISRLYLMVDFFFILSGFVLAHVYGRWFAEGERWPDFRQFIIARFARIYPLHLAMLLAVALIFGISNRVGISENPILQAENSLYSFITNLLLLQSMNLHGWFSWDHASWSISTEWWMYMLFPLLVRPMSRLSGAGRWLVVAGCFAGYAAITYWLFYLVQVTPALSFMFGNGPAPGSNNTINVAFQFGFVRCLCGFVLGLSTYRAYREQWSKAWLGNGYTLLALAFGIAGCMHLAITDLITVAFLPFILLSGAYGSIGIDRLFCTKPLQKLGDWSYSIYLIHQPLLFAIGNILAYQTLGKSATGGPPPKPDMLMGWLMCLAFIALTLLMASLTYRFIEVPARRALNTRFHKPTVPASNFQPV